MIPCFEEFHLSTFTLFSIWIIDFYQYKWPQKIIYIKFGGFFFFIYETEETT